MLRVNGLHARSMAVAASAKVPVDAGLATPANRPAESKSAAASLNGAGAQAPSSAEAGWYPDDSRQLRKGFLRRDYAQVNGMALYRLLLA